MPGRKEIKSIRLTDLCTVFRHIESSAGTISWRGVQVVDCGGGIGGLRISSLHMTSALVVNYDGCHVSAFVRFLQWAEVPRNVIPCQQHIHYRYYCNSNSYCGIDRSLKAYSRQIDLIAGSPPRQKYAVQSLVPRWGIVILVLPLRHRVYQPRRTASGQRRTLSSDVQQPSNHNVSWYVLSK